MGRDSKNRAKNLVVTSVTTKSVLLYKILKGVSDNGISVKTLIDQYGEIDTPIICWLEDESLRGNQAKTFKILSEHEAPISMLEAICGKEEISCDVEIIYRALANIDATGATYYK